MHQLLSVGITKKKKTTYSCCKLLNWQMLGGMLPLKWFMARLLWKQVHECSSQRIQTIHTASVSWWTGQCSQEYCQWETCQRRFFKTAHVYHQPHSRREKKKKKGTYNAITFPDSEHVIPCQCNLQASLTLPVQFSFVSRFQAVRRSSSALASLGDCANTPADAMKNTNNTAK